MPASESILNSLVQQLIQRNNDLRAVVRFAMNAFQQIQEGQPVDVMCVVAQLEHARLQSELVALDAGIQVQPAVAVD